MSETETVNLSISVSETRSISEVASIISNEIQTFADKHKVGDQYDKEAIEQDMIYFLVKRNTLGLEKLEVHLLEDGEVSFDSFSGRRRATLIFNIHYVGRRYSK